VKLLGFGIAFEINWYWWLWWN